VISHGNEKISHYRPVAHTLKPKVGGSTLYSKQFFAKRQQIAQLEIKQFFQSAMAGDAFPNSSKS
jgi:hypothetical protein